MSFNLRKYFPLLISILVLICIIASVYSACVNATDGRFIYILDDTYIHLAYAKNIVLHDVWGVSRHEISSSTSSPLWTLILISVFSLTGVNELVPLILNTIISIVLLIVLFRIFNSFGISGLYNALTLITVVIITPLAINIFTGMEHILQSLLAVMFVFSSAKIMTATDNLPRRFTKPVYRLLLISAMLASVRYEDLILISLVSAIMLYRKQYLMALLILLSGIIPVIISGIISIKNGGYFLPNSVLMKLSLPGSSVITAGDYTADSIYTYIIMNKKLILLFAISLIMLIKQYSMRRTMLSEIPMLLFIILALILFHKISFSITFFRYDTYLIILGIVINAIALNDILSANYGHRINGKLVMQKKSLLVVLILYSLFLLYKSFDSEKIVVASRNIYEQQYQMSRFLSKYYSGKEVALNDIGAANFFSDIKSVDLIGIGNNYISDLRMNGVFDTDQMKEISETKHLKIAMLYESWFVKDGGLPQEWTKAGEWKIRDNFICGDETVSIYAADPEEFETLKNNLRDFSDELPETVIQSGEYVKN